MGASRSRVQDSKGRRSFALRHAFRPAILRQAAICHFTACGRNGVSSASGKVAFAANLAVVTGAQIEEWTADHSPGGAWLRCYATRQDGLQCPGATRLEQRLHAPWRSWDGQRGFADPTAPSRPELSLGEAAAIRAAAGHTQPVIRSICKNRVVLKPPGS